MKPAHTLLHIFSCKDLGQGEQKVGTVSLEELGHLGWDRQGSGGRNKQKWNKRAENMNQTFKKQIGVGKLPKAELVVT